MARRGARATGREPRVADVASCRRACPASPGARRRRPIWRGWTAPGSALGDEPADVFLRRGRVAVSRGLDYGPEGAGHVRLNFATSPEHLDEALDADASRAGHHRLTATRPHQGDHDHHRRRPPPRPPRRARHRPRLRRARRLHARAARSRDRPRARHLGGHDQRAERRLRGRRIRTRARDGRADDHVRRRRAERDQRDHRQLRRARPGDPHRRLAGERHAGRPADRASLARRRRVHPLPRDARADHLRARRADPGERRGRDRPRPHHGPRRASPGLPAAPGRRRRVAGHRHP